MAATPNAVSIALPLPVIDVAAPAASNAPITILDSADISCMILSKPAITVFVAVKSISAPRAPATPNIVSPTNKPPRKPVIARPMAATPFAISTGVPLPLEATALAAIKPPIAIIASGVNSFMIPLKPFAASLVAFMSKSKPAAALAAIASLFSAIRSCSSSLVCSVLN